MYATEFKTIIDKPFIQIPEYERFKGKKVRIVLLHLGDNDCNQNKKEDFFERIIKNPKHIKDITFLSREEAHER